MRRPVDDFGRDRKLRSRETHDSMRNLRAEVGTTDLEDDPANAGAACPVLERPFPLSHTRLVTLDANRDVGEHPKIHFAPPDWLEPSLERGFGRLEVLRAEPDWRVYPESVVSPLERSSLGRAAERDGDASLVRLAVLCSAGDEGLVPDLEEGGGLEDGG